LGTLPVPDSGKILSVRAPHARMLADDLGDGNTGYLIERALDEARSRQFTLFRIRASLVPKPYHTAPN